MGRVKKAIRALKKEEGAARVEVSAKDSIQKAMLNLNQNMSAKEQRSSISFEEFLNELVAHPKTVTRSIFQVFHDMMKAYVGEGIDEYPTFHHDHVTCHPDQEQLVVDLIASFLQELPDRRPSSAVTFNQRSGVPEAHQHALGLLEVGFHH